MQQRALILAVVCGIGGGAPLVHADLIAGQEIQIQFFGTGGNLLVEGPHPFAGLGNSYDLAGNLGGGITVTSQELIPPPGKKFSGEITFDFNTMDTGDITAYLSDSPISISILAIKEPALDGNFINLLAVPPVLGTVFTDGASIFFEESFAGTILSTGGILQISWNQVPAPGALGLLGLAGLIGTRRRQRKTRTS